MKTCEKLTFSQTAGVSEATGWLGPGTVQEAVGRGGGAGAGCLQRCVRGSSGTNTLKLRLHPTGAKPLRPLTAGGPVPV